MTTFVTIVVYVPVSHADAIRKVMAECGCGHFGNYDSCSFSVRGIGRFRPLKGANPFIGEVGELKEVEEEKIETVCPVERITETVRAVRAAHPYEEPAIYVYPQSSTPE